MAFTNRFRLPFKLTRPQFLEERETFRKSNGVIVVLSNIIRKQYEGETDNWPEKLHERFKIALSHDNVTIEGERYAGDIVQEGDYTINWSDFLDYPLAKATFKVFATPFDASNTNCGVCADYIQVVAVDDNLGNLTEGQAVDAAVLANDSICCDPAELTIITTNSNYVQSIAINGQELSIQIKSPVATQNNVLLATYRVQCENGQYDEANVYANITGSEEVCLAPQALTVHSITEDSATVTVFGPFPLPSNGREWELRQGFTVVDSGVLMLGSLIFLSGLQPSTTYTIYVRSNCGDGDFSDYLQDTFTTDPPSETESCGSYSVYFDNGSGQPHQVAFIEYYDCNGDTKYEPVRNQQSITICALQNSPGDPVLINGGPDVDIVYLGLC